MSSLPSLPTDSCQFRSSSGCQGCERLQAPPQGPGKVHIYLPLRHSADKFSRTLKANGLVCDQSANMVVVDWDKADLSGFVALADSVLTPIERGAGRALFQPQNSELKEKDFFTATSIDRFLGQLQVDWLQNLLSERRIFSVFQPIVKVENADIYAYESLMRGAEAQVDYRSTPDHAIPPYKLIEVGKRAGLLFHLDLAARQAAIRGAAMHGVKQKVFINFTPTSIYDPKYCLASTIDLINEYGFEPSQIIFEVIESEQVREVAHLTSILDVYRQNGFGVALDDIGAAYSSLNMLLQLRPDYMKIDREMITGVHNDSYKATIVSKLLETAHNLGIKSVAEGVEEEAEWQWLKQHGADLVQGYFFARPNLPPPTKVLH
jgi:EAL domain-containing protein (putative c-di-GMP-specific phosphodiesterase class I)